MPTGTKPERAVIMTLTYKTRTDKPIFDYPKAEQEACEELHRFAFGYAMDVHGDSLDAAEMFASYVVCKYEGDWVYASSRSMANEYQAWQDDLRLSNGAVRFADVPFRATFAFDDPKGMPHRRRGGDWCCPIYDDGSEGENYKAQPSRIAYILDGAR